MGARADVVGDLSGGELVGTETGARIAEAIAAEAGDESAGGGGSAGPDIYCCLSVDGKEGEGELCLGL